MNGFKLRDRIFPDPIIATATAITVRDAAYSQPPPLAECNHPFPPFMTAAPKTIGTAYEESSRV
ncbi:MAG: hypothetical protein H8E12_16550 [Rhodobacteraceae bacterium]|nr:hypothetical protein [Paracoccaceae bacterium]